MLDWIYIQYKELNMIQKQITDIGELIAEYCTGRFNNDFRLNWDYSNWHITDVNKVKGLTYQEYEDWCKEIGVKVD